MGGESYDLAMGPDESLDEPLVVRVEQLRASLADLQQAGAAFRQTLTRLGDALASTHDRPAMVSAVLETIALYLRAQTGVFYERVAGSNRLRPTAMCRVTPEGKAQSAAPSELPDLVLNEGVAGTAAETGEVVVWPPVAGPSSSPPEPSSDEPTTADTPAVAVPIRAGSQPFGVVALYGRAGGRPFLPDDVDTVQTLVRQAETAIENAYLYEEARHLSLTDGLTGLWNLRHFELRLSEELSRAVRFREAFSVVNTDLDGFKAVNDTYGHQTGHGVLVEVARRLKDATREVDLVARLGGDEIGMLLPKTGVAGALRLAEKLRKAVADEPFVIDELSLRITMSLGVAAYPEHGGSEKELFAAADSALYRAKKMGGNRVEHAKVGGGPEGRAR